MQLYASVEQFLSHPDPEHIIIFSQQTAIRSDDYHQFFNEMLAVPDWESVKVRRAVIRSSVAGRNSHPNVSRQVDEYAINREMVKYVKERLDEKESLR